MRRASAHSTQSLTAPSLDDVSVAQARMQRFAPLLSALFPELQATEGQVCSPLISVPQLQQALIPTATNERLWVKADHLLPVAGSVKARGGFHEVLQWTENLAQKNGLLCAGDDVRALSRPAARRLFHEHQVAVGSTGNLGMSIGLIASALGFKATVHMSHDAKAWKKRLLRDHGVSVIEHQGDYALAVAKGREEARALATCHFVDDERSLSLLLGYACAAFELSRAPHRGRPYDRVGKRRVLPPFTQQGSVACQLKGRALLQLVPSTCTAEFVVEDRIGMGQDQVCAPL